MTTSNSSLSPITATESATSIAREELSIDDDDGEPEPPRLKSDERQELHKRRHIWLALRADVKGRKEFADHRLI